MKKLPVLFLGAEIDDLLSRYLFALDSQDPQLYGEVFAPDGVLVWAGGTVNGRAAIVSEMRNARAADERINGDKATARPLAESTASGLQRAARKRGGAGRQSGLVTVSQQTCA